MRRLLIYLIERPNLIRTISLITLYIGCGFLLYAICIGGSVHNDLAFRLLAIGEVIGFLSFIGIYIANRLAR